MLPRYVIDLLRNQHGLAAHHQIQAVEPNPVVRRRIYRHPELEPATPRVIRHIAAPRSPTHELVRAVLDAGPGAVLWGKSGACHWGFGRFRLLPAHVAVPRRRVSGTRLGQIHVVRDLQGTDITVHDDVPIARPEIVVLWLLGMWTHRLGHELAAERGAILLDHAWRQRLIDGHRIHELTARAGGRGRSGIVVLRWLLEDRPPDYTPAGSRLEERFEEVVGPAVAARLDRQVTVDAERAIRTVDFRVHGRPVVIEINGEAFHTSVSDRAHDDERYTRLLELGFSVVVLWEWDIWHDPMSVRQAVIRILDGPDVHASLHRPTRAPWQW